MRLDKGHRVGYAGLLCLTVPLGGAVRFARWGLPYSVMKYGGSAFWAFAIYWLLAVCVPRSTVVRRVTLALLLAFAIEFFKLVRMPGLDHFRLTLAGKLLLGRIFSVRDLLAYLLAILLAAALDYALFAHSRNRTL